MNEHEKLAMKLRVKGFDQSFAGDDGVNLVCSQCVAVAINGYPCHETRCPNKVRV